MRIFVSVLLVVVGMFAGAKLGSEPRQSAVSFHFGPAAGGFRPPLWLQVELQDTDRNGSFSYGACVRGLKEIRSIEDAVALNLQPQAQEQSIRVRLSTNPSRPQWMGAIPNIEGMDVTCP